MSRKKNRWFIALSAELERASTTPFAWGSADCSLFVADAVQAMTGVDFAADFRGTYTDEAGARAAAADAGGLQAIVTAALGAPLDNPRFAQRGDVVMVRTLTAAGKMDRALGLCLGDAAACRRLDGVARVPMLQWSAAWRV